MLSLLYLRVKALQCFASLSYMFLDKKTVFKIWLNLRVNMTKVPGPCVDDYYIVIYCLPSDGQVFHNREVKHSF